VSSVNILYEFVSSDHRPVSVCFDNLVLLTSSASSSSDTTVCNNRPNWMKATDYNITMKCVIVFIGVILTVLRMFAMSIVIILR